MMVQLLWVSNLKLIHKKSYQSKTLSLFITKSIKHTKTNMIRHTHTLVSKHIVRNSLSLSPLCSQHCPFHSHYITLSILRLNADRIFNSPKFVLLLKKLSAELQKWIRKRKRKCETDRPKVQSTFACSWLFKKQKFMLREIIVVPAGIVQYWKTCCVELIFIDFVMFEIQHFTVESTDMK